MNKNSRILITGSEGMVGKALSKELKNLDFNNVILVDKKKIDLTDREKTISFFKKNKPEYIFHAASKVGGIMDNIEKPVEFLRDNLLINTNVLDAAFICKAKKMISLNSATIYSNKLNNPSEDDLFREKIEEENESYALSKLIALKLSEYYNKEYNTEFISLALPNLYGEYAKFDIKRANVVAALISKFHKAKKEKMEKVSVWGSGKAIREFIYSKDLAKILILSMIHIKKNDTVNGILNCGSDDIFTIKELALVIKKIIGFEGVIEFDISKPEGAKKRTLNSDRFKKIIKLKQRTSLEDGIKSTYRYFLHHNLKNEK